MRGGATTAIEKGRLRLRRCRAGLTRAGTGSKARRAGRRPWRRRERAPDTTSIGVTNIIYSSEAWHHDASYAIISHSRSAHTRALVPPPPSAPRLAHPSWLGTPPTGPDTGGAELRNFHRSLPLRQSYINGTIVALLRPDVGLGRRNYLFAGSDEGGRTWAIIASPSTAQNSLVSIRKNI
jgi:hypothetical protein